MIELGITQKDLALKLDISIQNSNDKLNGRGVLSIIEAKKITEILKLENPYEIFFADKVPNMQQKTKIEESEI